MDVSIYSNLFQVHWDIQIVEIMRVGRSKFPDLRELRNQLHDHQIEVQVYELEDDIYGYGQQQTEVLREADALLPAVLERANRGEL